MKHGIYLEEALKDVLRTSNFIHGMFNLITAPCGSGKTTAAINVISKLASSPRTALFLIDTANGKHRLARLQELAMPYAYYEESLSQTWFPSDEFDPAKIVVTTYAQFGVWAYHNPNFHSFFDVIICDEAHNIVTFPAFCKQTPNYAAIARDALCAAVWNCNTLVVGMTATPDKLIKLNCRINQLPIDVTKLRQYENKEVRAYVSLPQLFQQLPKGKRGALFTVHVTQMQKCERLAIAAGFHPICVWSTGSEHPMTGVQLAARQYILENECVPPQYDLFIFNDSCATSINLFGEMDYIVLHTTDSTRMIQARGRYRGDIDVLYCYDRDEEEVVVPDEFLEVELYSEDKQELRTVLDIKQKSGKPLPYKQMFWLLESNGYRLEFGRRNNRHYFIIRKL